MKLVFLWQKSVILRDTMQSVINKVNDEWWSGLAACVGPMVPRDDSWTLALLNIWLFLLPNCAQRTIFPFIYCNFLWFRPTFHCFYDGHRNITSSTGMCCAEIFRVRRGLTNQKSRVTKMTSQWSATSSVMTLYRIARPRRETGSHWHSLNGYSQSEETSG